jgi:hypothetical protein
VTQIPTDSTTPKVTLARSRCFHAIGAALSAGALLALLVGTLAAVNPALHLWLHPDAQQPGHECFVRLVENHQLIAADVGTVVALAPASLDFHSQSTPDFRPGRFDFLLPPSRGPPLMALR